MRYFYDIIGAPMVLFVWISAINLAGTFEIDIYKITIPLIFVTLLILALYLKLRRNLEKLKKIGFLEIVSYGINISIGNYSRVIPFKEIDTITLEKFFTPVDPKDLWNKHTCYILIISHKQEVEKVIVDSISMINRKLCILTSLNYLSRKKLVRLISNI